MAKRIKDLSGAKHRYDSYAKPLGRCCLYLPAVLAMAQSVVDERGQATSEGRGCLRLLNFISEARLILLGMVADASDESLAFVRFLDDESCDKSSLAHEVFHFLTNITHPANLDFPSVSPARGPK